MLWFLVVHISALLIWSAALLYLPTLIARSVPPSDTETGSTAAVEESLARYLYTRIATPAALVAIVAGTLVFVSDYRVEVWLLAKLTLVAGLVVCHVLLGVLTLRAEDALPVQPWCRVIVAVMMVLMLGILWLVLTKPAVEELLWRF